MPDKDRLTSLLSEYGVQERYISDLCDEIDECYVDELEAAEKWRVLEKKYPNFCKRFDVTIDALEGEGEKG
jgi:hypothetical protein